MAAEWQQHVKGAVVMDINSLDKVKQCLKVLCCIAPLCCGIYAAIMYFVAGNMWSGLGSLLTGIGISWGIMMSFMWGRLELNMNSLWFVLCTALGVIGVFAGSKMFDHRYIEVRQELVFAFLSAPTYCSSDLTELMLKGAEHCSTQLLSDMMDFSSQMSKAIRLDPVSSLVDSTYSAGQDKKVDRCLVDYIVLKKQCPDAFLMVEKKFPELLH
ncbi:hypothetical protein H5A35_08995 [Pectobacterium brasiliense]|uniref:hypothetical protein n=1 Tax=Pectobacterium brasiliense TaxID=180957 RepID=UPI001968B32E|nr:hypothetical protein [Pectobacterium brasiliense]MBN3207549.1 hypothetical protein [Pectobacterium brasiliense]